mmetsp:Transcript_532/g.724  ORF Transcript_532/g.724 Transcript_532/m.724 type:complete len:98 (+) Transcript_532:333-626(+)
MSDWRTMMGLDTKTGKRTMFVIVPFVLFAWGLDAYVQKYHKPLPEQERNRREDRRIRREHYKKQQEQLNQNPSFKKVLEQSKAKLSQISQDNKRLDE